MTATSSAPIDSLVVNQLERDSLEEAYDPLPDETVLKTGWLNKKGRRGVFAIYTFVY